MNLGFSGVQIPLQFEGVARSDGVAATREITTPPVGHPFKLKGNLGSGYRVSKRPRQQNPRIHILDIRMPAKRHRDVQLFVDDLQRFGHARLAHRAQPVDHGTADEDAFGS